MKKDVDCYKCNRRSVHRVRKHLKHALMRKVYNTKMQYVVVSKAIIVNILIKMMHNFLFFMVLVLASVYDSTEHRNFQDTQL